MGLRLRPRWVVVVMAAICASLWLASCAPRIEAGVRTIYVSGNTVPCSYSPTSQCLLVRDKETDPWAPLEAEFVGFDYKPGYEYVVVVEVEPLEGTKAGFRLRAKEAAILRRVSPTETPTPRPTPPPTPTAAPSPTPALGWAVLGNATFRSKYVPEGEVTLHDGAYRQVQPDGSIEPPMILIEQIANGDLDGDGRDDAAVALASYTGGEAVQHNVAAVLDRPGGPVNVANAYLGDRIVVRQVTIHDGIIDVEMTVHGPGESPCCPSYDGRATFHLVGDQLVEP